MSKIIVPMSAEAAFRKALAETEERYMFSKQPEETQKLLRAVFRAGWVASKYNTFEILETLAGDDNGK